MTTFFRSNQIIAGPTCPLPTGDGGHWLVLSTSGAVLSRWHDRAAADAAALDPYGVFDRQVIHRSVYMADCQACGESPRCA